MAFINISPIFFFRFYPTSTHQYDLLVLADGYSVNLHDNYRFDKEVILKSYELKINFPTTKNQLQNNETEILSLLQTRYFLEQNNNQNFLKINLSKSEYDNIDFNVDSALNSIKSNPWFINLIRDGFKFFEVNVDDEESLSITKSSEELLVSKEFYKSYQQLDGQFVCVIGDSAFNSFNCNSWHKRYILAVLAVCSYITLIRY